MPDLSVEQTSEGQISTVVLSPQDQQVFGASIRRVDDTGVEYWSAREMAKFLGYGRWNPFQSLVARVERGLANAGIDTTFRFRHIETRVILGNGAERSIDDVHLSRIGFLLVLQNADGAKALVAYGKNYVIQQMLRSTQTDRLPFPVQAAAMLMHSPWVPLKACEQENSLGMNWSARVLVWWLLEWSTLMSCSQVISVVRSRSGAEQPKLASDGRLDSDHLEGSLQRCYACSHRWTCIDEQLVTLRQ